MLVPVPTGSRLTEPGSRFRSFMNCSLPGPLDLLFRDFLFNYFLFWRFGRTHASNSRALALFVDESQTSSLPMSITKAETVLRQYGSQATLHDLESTHQTKHDTIFRESGGWMLLGDFGGASRAHSGFHGRLGGILEGIWSAM